MSMFFREREREREREKGKTKDKRNGKMDSSFVTLKQNSVWTYIPFSTQTHTNTHTNTHAGTPSLSVFLSERDREKKIKSDRERIITVYRAKKKNEIRRET